MRRPPALKLASRLSSTYTFDCVITHRVRHIILLHYLVNFDSASNQTYCYLASLLVDIFCVKRLRLHIYAERATLRSIPIFSPLSRDSHGIVLRMYDFDSGPAAIHQLHTELKNN